MDIQITNEVTSFWQMFFSPICFISFTLLVFYLLLGKYDFFNLISSLFLQPKSKYVYSNGLYIPRKYKIGNRFINKFFWGNEDNKHISLLVKVFFILLSIYTVDRLLTSLMSSFQISTNANILLASLYESTLAEIWSYYPDTNNIYSLWEKIKITYSNLDDNIYKVNTIFYTLERYIKLNILICLLFPFLPLRKNKRLKSIIRASSIVVALLFILSLVYFNYMHESNKEMAQKCFKVLSYHNEGVFKAYDEYQDYVYLVNEIKKKNSHKLFYGAYNIRFDFVDGILKTYTEILRIYNNEP